MIITEIHGDLAYTFSDAGYTIIQDGTDVEYFDAWDPIDSNRTYRESTNKRDEPIDEMLDEPAPDDDSEIE